MTDAPEQIWAWADDIAGIVGVNAEHAHIGTAVNGALFIRLDLHEAAVAAARAEGMRKAARIGGDAAVAVLLRHEPDASILRQQATRQTIAVPIFKAAEASK